MKHSYGLKYISVVLLTKLIHYQNYFHRIHCTCSNLQEALRRTVTVKFGGNMKILYSLNEF